MQFEFETLKQNLMKKRIKIYMLFRYMQTHIYTYKIVCRYIDITKKILWAINQAEIFWQKHVSLILIVVTNMYNSFTGCLLQKGF